ncbi:hypothetical protein [Bradyrhizobium sp. CCBAU 45384]|uniref:hypothetical protein n=1 Tax=Bradyrhizobium sp. CCBAU 45384 TaxID=858428 RepID=UPI002305BE78|nr:hypothetical protein [Bradyrhizobium sp. CCBAU 45384]MDA9405350.1 hypothetical protein [Bradyrhizobium sp. CCBAU 45384]
MLLSSAYALVPCRWRHRADLSTGIIPTKSSALISSQVDIGKGGMHGTSDWLTASVADLDELFSSRNPLVAAKDRFVD